MKAAARIAISAGIVLLAAARALAAEPAPIQVFILAGQSNMEGKGSVLVVENQLANPAKKHRFAHLRNHDEWLERDDVWIHYRGGRGVRSGPLTIGYGVSQTGHTELFGPELGFGWTVGDRLEAPVLLIKTGWGGKSLDQDFRPPSRGFPASIEQALEQARKRNPAATLDAVRDTYGHYYRLMIEEIRSVTADLSAVVPQDWGPDFEFAGFVWFQGWNDQYAPTSVEDYRDNLVAFVADVRKDLHAPTLPFVIGAMGHGGANQKGKIKQIAEAQVATAAHPPFDGAVVTVRTADYWDSEAEKAYQTYWADEPNRDMGRWRQFGNDHSYHYLGSPLFFYNAGVGFGEAMIGPLDSSL